MSKKDANLAKGSLKESKKDVIHLKYMLIFGFKGIWTGRKSILKNQHVNNNFDGDLHFCRPLIFYLPIAAPGALALHHPRE
jgi:hypothetical protein